MAILSSNEELENKVLYQYTPLEGQTSIRIFHLEPGQEGDPLRCTIEHLSVNSGAKFSAISYVVGSEDTSHHRILVAGDQYIPLTASLHEVLQNIRAIGDIKRKIFWADQICIGKDNIDERNHQVALMGTIYRKAVEVITYIGPETPNDRKGIGLIQTINDLWEQIQHFHPGLHYTEVKSIVERHLPGTDDPAWDGFGSIIYRSWSTRVWMIQENVLNQNTLLVCGKITFPFIIPSIGLQDIFADHLPERLKFALHNYQDGDSGTLRILPLPSFGKLIFLRAWMKENQSNSMRLLDLLRIGCNFACRDPRDKVYALLGLASENLGIVPDYEKRPARVFVDTALRILQSSSNLDLLNHVGGSKEIELPSWVPDWSVPKTRFLLNSRFIFSTECVEHCASADTTSEVEFDADHSILIARGIIIDSIRYSAGDPTINVSGVAQEPDQILVEYPRMMEAFQKICKVFNYQTHTGHIPAELLNSLSRTITTDRAVLRDVEGGNAKTCFLAYLKMCQFRYEKARFKINGESMPRGEYNSTTQAEGLQFLKHSLIAEGRSLCVTTSGRLCLAPSETMVGDKVTILYGGKTPYILRPIGEIFEFVGESYVHGLMKGEALADPKFHSTVRTIRLI